MAANTYAQAFPSRGAPYTPLLIKILYIYQGYQRLKSVAKKTAMLEAKPMVGKISLGVPLNSQHGG